MKKTILNMLEQKNHYLSQFDDLSEKQLKRLRAGNFSHIKSFYHHRQMILNAMETIDKKLKKGPRPSVSQKSKDRLKTLLYESRLLMLSIQMKDRLIHKILTKKKSGGVYRRLAG